MDAQAGVPLRSEGKEIHKVIYAVRHGESEANVLPIYQGESVPLTSTGIAQAYFVAERLAGLPIEALLSSTMVRARETAREIERRTKLSAEHHDIFVERIKPSSICGKPYADSTAAQKWARWNESFYSEGPRVEDGETFGDIVARADLALAFLLERPERVIALVSHGYFLRVVAARILLGTHLTGTLLRGFQGRMEMMNTGISVLRHESRFDGTRWCLWSYNDHSHLD